MDYCRCRLPAQNIQSVKKYGHIVIHLYLNGLFNCTAATEMLGTLPIGAILWLLLGGVFYIGGTYYYAMDKQLSRWMHSHELWHLFVIGGALSHYIYNFMYIFK